MVHPMLLLDLKRFGEASNPFCQLQGWPGCGGSSARKTKNLGYIKKPLDRLCRKGSCKIASSFVFFRFDETLVREMRLSNNSYKANVNIHRATNKPCASRTSALFGQKSKKAPSTCTKLPFTVTIVSSKIDIR